jgi:hypothetical protein
MKNLFKTVFVLLAILLLAAATTSNCYGQKKEKKPKAKSSKKVTAPADYKLVYNIQAGKSLGYSSKTDMYLTADFSGQTFNITVSALLACTVTGKGADNGNLKLEMKIDTMSQVTDTPQGSNGGIISDVAGKSFNMLLSPAGKEVDLKEAEKIVFSNDGVETSVAQSFMDYFPDLPLKGVKPGDTWPTDDTLISKVSTTSMKQITHGENTFAGIETVDGVECAKITSVLTGTRETMAQSMGMDITQSFKFTGTSELFFAVKEGYYIKQVTNNKLNGSMEIGGAQNMSMPLAGDMVSVNRLKK